MAALPPEGALLLLDDMRVRAGGCAANVAIDLAKQGISVDLAGCVGADGAADTLFGILAAHGIDCSRIVRVEQCRTSKTVILIVKGQDRRYLHLAGANTAFTVDRLQQEWLSRLKVFYLGGLFAMPGIDFEKLAAMLSFCREKKVTTVVDVVIPHQVTDLSELPRVLPFIDMFVPNDQEAKAFTGLTDPFDQLRAFKDTGANTVIITRGERGSVAARGGKVWSCGAYRMDVVDPSGSGDAFTSGVIRSILLGYDIPQTLRYASAMGASVTRAAGTTDTAFSAEEAEAFLIQNPITVSDEN